MWVELINSSIGSKEMKTAWTFIDLLIVVCFWYAHNSSQWMEGVKGVIYFGLMISIWGKYSLLYKGDSRDSINDFISYSILYVGLLISDLPYNAFISLFLPWQFTEETKLFFPPFIDILPREPECPNASTTYIIDITMHIMIWLIYLIWFECGYCCDYWCRCQCRTCVKACAFDLGSRVSAWSLPDLLLNITLRSVHVLCYHIHFYKSHSKLVCNVI